ncbi:hypothetical protein TWF694_011487 [Orbilia ellipsospora]|uniref:Microtubule associated protein n=1 Tax=Orbilia ellipsospora TaxID=2528407 RepID=A0AAV9X5F4_9PEZI
MSHEHFDNVSIYPESSTGSFANLTSNQLPPAERDPNPPNAFVYHARKVYHPLGFKKGYNFTLFVIFAGIMFLFCLIRLPYLNVTGSASWSFFSNILPSDRYWYSNFTIYRVGITMHLAAIIPAGALMVFQFIPMIRYKLLIVHRVNGYIIITLVTIANIGAIMISRRAFGGGVEVQAAVATMAIMITTSIALAYYNIKKIQIEQHRKWMLRAMFYLGIIITMRVILFFSARAVNKSGEYWTAVDCQELQFAYQNITVFQQRYPSCLGSDGKSVSGFVAVHGIADGLVEQVSVGWKLSFGMAAWLSIILHVAGVEIYLALTPRETERLRQVSYQRQLERGYANAGRGGLTADKLGDAIKWTPNQG